VAREPRWRLPGIGPALGLHIELTQGRAVARPDETGLHARVRLDRVVHVPPGEVPCGRTGPLGTVRSGEDLRLTVLLPETGDLVEEPPRHPPPDDHCALEAIRAPQLAGRDTRPVVDRPAPRPSGAP